MSRILSLDILRFAAVIGVFICHTYHLYPNLHSGITLPGLAHSLANIGWTGVDLFFVLSGFLVSELLFSEYQRTMSLDIKKFLVRRAFKIYPAFYVFLAFIIVGMLVRGERVRERAVLCEVLFLQNYLPHLAWTGHDWSLAVEEHFYLLLPLALAILLKVNGNIERVPIVVLFCAISCLILRIATAIAIPHIHYTTHHFPTHLRIDSLAFGVLLGYWHSFNRESFVAFATHWKAWLLALTTICIFPAAILEQSNVFIETFGLTLLYLGYGALIVAMFGFDLPRNRLTTAIARLGKYSYSIYLWHNVVLLWFMPVLLKYAPPMASFWPLLLVYTPLALLFGSLMSILVEGPFLHLREWLMPRKARIESRPEKDHSTSRSSDYRRAA